MTDLTEKLAASKAQQEPIVTGAGDQMSNDELIEWIEKSSGTFEQWLSLMKFGAATFEAKPFLAMELIVREAERRRTNDPPNWCIANITVAILERLEWKLELSQ